MNGQLPIADPSILLHDGVYHAYGTGEDGFGVYSSNDLEHWVKNGIDTSLFIDDDGKAYLYFVRFTGGNVIWVAEMTEDLLGIKEETLTQCVAAEESWETIQGKAAEGPSVLKIKGIYNLLYSANDYKSHDYAVGYAAGLVETGHGALSLEGGLINPVIVDTSF